MHSFLFIVVIALCAQSIRCDGLPNPGEILKQIANETATTLQSSTIDASRIISGVNTAVVNGAQTVNDFYQSTVDRLLPEQRLIINDYVAQLKQAQLLQAPTCAQNYTSTINFYARIYTNNIVNCGHLRFGQLIEEAVQNFRTYVAAEVANLSADLQTAQYGGTSVAPKLVAAAADTLPLLIETVVALSWPRQTASYVICLAANNEEAQKAVPSVLATISGCKPSQF